MHNNSKRIKHLGSITAKGGYEHKTLLKKKSKEGTNK
jgi:hypothetical protein